MPHTGLRTSLRRLSSLMKKIFAGTSCTNSYLLLYPPIIRLETGLKKPLQSNTSLPDDQETRNKYPMADGLLDYFPNALAEVSRLSLAATQQHHPGSPMHWDRAKSPDHRNKILRHLIDTGSFDDKGQRHSTMVAWRALALLQEELEADLGLPLARAARTPDSRQAVLVEDLEAEWLKALSVE